jgi:hypothetical protein
MCEPTSILAMTAIVLTAVGGVQSYRAQKANADYQEQLGERNAEIGRRQASQERQIGNIDEERHLRKVRQLLGSQRAQQAANGLDINSGSALDLQAETAGFGGADAATIRSNSLRRAWGLEVGAVNDLNSGRAAAAESRNAATGTLISTGASMASMYQPGMFGGGGGAAGGLSRAKVGRYGTGVGAGAYGFGG